MQLSNAPASDRRDVEQQLVGDHLALVHYAVGDVANRVPRHVSRDDLTSAAMMGLAQAARTFDESRGVTFACYARTRIRGALLDELRSRDWASRSVRARARAMQSTTDELTATLARTPTSEEMAEHLGVDTAEVHQLADDVHRATVLNYESLFVDAEGESGLPSTGLLPDDILGDRERNAYLIDAVVALPERLRTVVVGYFFDERQMQDIADELGVTESRVSQMRSEALLLLREGIESQLEPDTLVEQRLGGRVARRKAAYFAAVAGASDFHSRLDAHPTPITQRLRDLTPA